MLLFSREIVHYKTLEILGLAGFATWLILLTSTLPTSGEKWMFILVSHFVSGILHVQITLSHFSMETFMGHPYTHGVENDEWFHEQVKTTMDIDCPKWMDWFHGGL
jgi:delta8-fatty-acid desaturase